MNGKNEEEKSRRSKPPSEREIFGISGPYHLTFVDWRIPEHRRSVAASLVQGVYILERDRQQNRIGHKALAPNWFLFFHFQCIQILIDQVDSSIFGAIFEYKFPQTHHQSPPHYVIAFRGTLPKPDTRKRDLYLDLQLGVNGLTRNTRFQTALQELECLISKSNPQKVWLAGHSLGAAISLQAGKNMAKKGCFIETYLFNPPFISPPIEKLNNSTLKTGIRVASSCITAGLTTLVTKSKNNNGTMNNSQHYYDPFNLLCTWIPYLFLNPKDPICCEYIGYFEHRERMEKLHVGGIERIATKNSVMGLLSGVFGRESEASHLIPTGFVIKNMICGEQDFKISHGIHQWWRPHPFWQSKLYQFRSK